MYFHLNLTLEGFFEGFFSFNFQSFTQTKILNLQDLSHICLVSPYTEPVSTALFLSPDICQWNFPKSLTKSTICLMTLIRWDGVKSSCPRNSLCAILNTEVTAKIIDFCTSATPWVVMEKIWHTESLNAISNTGVQAKH